MDDAVKAKWPFPQEFLVGVRRGDGSIEHYLHPNEEADPLQARKEVEAALLDKKAVLVRVK